MAKKTKTNNDEIFEGGFDVDEESTSNVLPDFDVDMEYKEEPLIPQMVTKGAIQNVSLSNSMVKIDFLVQDTDAVMSDGETPVEGASVSKKIWLPKESDKHEQTKSGKQTKYQFKINQLKRFCDQSGINLRTPKAIQDAVDGSLTGEEYKIEINVDTYNNQTFNVVENVYALN
jgi:hypothetical protein